MSDESSSDAPAVVVRAPDKIWLCVGDLYDCKGCEVEFADISKNGEVSWCADKVDESDVPYVRADLYSAMTETNDQLTVALNSSQDMILAKDARIAELEAKTCSVTLSGRALREAAECANPDEGDETQLECEVEIMWLPGGVTMEDGTIRQAGYYLLHLECPEEGITGPLGEPPHSEKGEGE